MRQLIFKRLSSTVETESTKIIDDFTDVKQCEHLLLSYQAAVYGQHDNALIACPSVRIKHVAQDNYPINTLLTNIKTLFSVIKGLQITTTLLQKEYEKQLFWKRLLGRFSHDNPDSYARAYERVTCVQKSILLEANLLGHALSSKLLNWYQAKKPLTRSKLEEQSHLANTESLFFNTCKQLSNLQAINNLCAKEKNRLKKAEISFKYQETNSETEESAGLYSAQIGFKESIQNNLKSIGIIPHQLKTLIRQQQSFWKSERYKASLFFLRIDYRRHIQESQDIISSWQSLNNQIQAVKQYHSQLNSLFHRSLKKLYNRLECEMLERINKLAVMGLTELINQQHFIEYYGQHEVVINQWIKPLPVPIQEYWNIMLEGLLNPEYINPVNWKSAFHGVYDYLNILAISERDLLKKWVQQYIIRHVKSKRHPAYTLVSQYTDALIEAPPRKNIIIPEEEPVSITLINRINDAVYLSIECLHNLSRQPTKQKLISLTKLDLNQRDLISLINLTDSELKSYSNYNSLLSQLRFISTTFFSSPKCQEQAKLLIEMMSPQVLESKQAIAQRYLNLNTTQNLHATGLFTQSARGAGPTEKSVSTLQSQSPSQEKYHAS